MKKHILTLVLTIFCTICAFSKVYVDVKQFPAKPGSKYDTDLATPLVVYEKLRDGIMNIRYNFFMNVEKGNKIDRMNMKIEFPSDVKYSVLAVDGIAAFVLEEEQVPALLEHENYLECFIPVREDGSGFIEIQLAIPKNLVGSDIPIKINFDGYQLKSGTKVLSFVSRVLLGPIVDIAATSAISTYQKSKHEQMKIEERFSEIKKKMKKISLTNSMKQYRIQVR